jgi:hypothetical protein
MRPKKRSNAAKDRERLKRQRIDPPKITSDGSQYAPSEGQSTTSDNPTSEDEVRAPDELNKARDALFGLWQSDFDDVSESDGEIMLGLGDSFDENDWDPGVVPDLYPIFTEPVCICLSIWYLIDTQL